MFFKFLNFLEGDAILTQYIASLLGKYKFTNTSLQNQYLCTEKLTSLHKKLHNEVHYMYNALHYIQNTLRYVHNAVHYIQNALSYEVFCGVFVKKRQWRHAKMKR